MNAGTRLDRPRRQVAAPGRHVPLTGATIVTVDPRLGVPPEDDLPVRGGEIAALGPDQEGHFRETERAVRAQPAHHADHRVFQP
ncbi:hypothetical protein GCM10022252_48380 [Streptosporangium oxazolinicum]|uniref:Uncharacterized protein n=1 Tax=Streptosporangium oxazolinicum TaxID=909287 RepID=A0ABP8B4Y0_9ACTN